MSYIEILILRRLRSGPAHGYELRKRVEQTTGFVLHNNSLYPALRRFEEAGAVKGAERQEGRTPRLVYTLTAVGRELLHDMLVDCRPSRWLIARSSWPVSASSRNQFCGTGRGACCAHRAVREQLAHYEAMLDLAVAHGERWGALATGELIRRHERELAWLAELGELAQDDT